MSPGPIKERGLEYTTGRPYMPGYSIAGAGDTEGMIPWHLAEMRLTQSRHYWVVTLWPDGRPHLTTVWGAWNQDALWFSTGAASRKFKNLTADPRCTISTEDGSNPVVLEGAAELVRNPALVAIFLNRINSKYRTSFGIEFMNPREKACFRVKPRVAIALEEERFTGSPTRWEFET